MDDKKKGIVVYKLDFGPMRYYNKNQTHVLDAWITEREFFANESFRNHLDSHNLDDFNAAKKLLKGLKPGQIHFLITEQ